MLRSFRIPWAHDRWFGEDKLTHAAWCYAGALTFLLIVPWLLALFLVVAAAVAVEVVQWARWEIWQHDLDEYGREYHEVGTPAVEGEPLRPAFADQPSYRDLAWDAGGIVLGVIARLLVLWVLGR